MNFYHYHDADRDSVIFVLEENGISETMQVPAQVFHKTHDVDLMIRSYKKILNAKLKPKLMNMKQEAGRVPKAQIINRANHITWLYKEVAVVLQEGRY